MIILLFYYCRFWWWSLATSTSLISVKYWLYYACTINYTMYIQLTIKNCRFLLPGQWRASSTLCHRITVYSEGQLSGTTCPHFSYVNICSLLARRRGSYPVQRVYWSVHAFDWQLLATASCVMWYARGQKLQKLWLKLSFSIKYYSVPVS